MRIVVNVVFAMFFFMSRSEAKVIVVHSSGLTSVIDENYNFIVDVPPRWYASSGNPVPFVFSYSPSKLASAQVGVPAGGAQISIVSDAGTYHTGSIEKWIEEDNRHGSANLRKLELSRNPLLSHLVQATRYEDVGDSVHEQVITTTTVYFEFHGEAYAAILSFNANDPNARNYQHSLLDLVRSFREAPSERRDKSRPVER